MTAHESRTVRLAEEYDRARPRLQAVAYAVLGSRAEAEDVVADCWLRLVQADVRDPVLDVEAWATVTVARAALDVLRSARRRREVYTGPWLPEPVLGDASIPVDPADRVTLDEHVRYALLVVLETLTPAERTAWVLHDLFGMGFTEVAAVVGRTPAAVRQLAARARSHVDTRVSRVPVSRAEHDAAVRAFADAVAGGDLARMVRVLDPDVVLTSDGGGMVSAARRPVVGAERVGRFLLGLAAKRTAMDEVRPMTVNGLLGLGTFTAGRLTTAVVLTVDAGRVTRVDMVRAPAKLSRLPS